MSCKFACMCVGNCIGCSDRESESYFGEAEDLLSQQMGYRNYDDHMGSIRNNQIKEEI
ncbi:MAG: hypothetical protein ACYDEI_00260 [Erysipelotrichaceae bacterium]